MREYVVLDVETTGFYPGDDKIIQIALKHSSGQTFESFINPERPIPEHIRQLTGFHDVDFATYPTIEELRGTIQEWVRETWVVGHSISFDRNFLEMEGIRTTGQIDTLEWSRLIFPGRPSYRLRDFFTEDGDGLTSWHDARYDVRMTESLLQMIYRNLLLLPEQTKTDLAYLLGEEWIWWGIERQTSERLSPLDNPGPDSSGVQELERRSVSGDGAAWLSKGGPISRALPGFESRASQLAMAAAVDRNFEDGGILMVEAGTGTGKSLAYLTPALIRSLGEGSRVVVATHTVALQEQLWHKDLPTAKSDLSLGTSLLKGRGRYVCLLKADTARREAEVLALNPDERWALAKLLVFVALTDSGDGDAFNAKTDAARKIWNDVVADRHACAGSRCLYAGPCFMRRARKQAESSHLVVVNHALLAAHLASGNVLPEFSHVVIDEAHHFADVVERAFGLELNIADFIQSLQEMTHSGHGLLERLRTHPDFFSSTDLISSLSRQLITLFGELGERLVEQTPPSEYDRRSVRVTDTLYAQWDQDSVGDLLRSVAEVLAELYRVSIDTYALAESIYGPAVQEEPLWLRFQKWAEELGPLAASMEGWGRPNPDWVSWWETRGLEKTVVTIRTAPVNVAELLRTGLWDSVQSAVLTSATLSVDGDFGYMTANLGLPEERTRAIQLPSPFNVAERSRLVVPSDMVDVSDPGFLEQMADFVVQVVSLRRGRTLILMTAYKMLKWLNAKIRPILEARGIAVLAQGIDGPADRLVQQFRRSSRAILLGTMSYWEGVDVPGEQLEVVIMARLPFQAPGDPVEEARYERIRAAGRSPFYQRTLPQAILRFQQGFGRLLRTSEDRGVVVVLDRRILPSQTRYGRRFISSLPDPPVIYSDSETLLEELRKFFDS